MSNNIFRKLLFSTFFSLVAINGTASGQTIAEKKLSLGQRGQSDLSEEMQLQLTQVNEQQEIYRKELQALYREAENMYLQNAPEEAFFELLQRIQLIKDRIKRLEEDWRFASSQNLEDAYALWHQPSTTLEQLIIDYGSQDYVYAIPPEIASLPISVSSNLPIPRSSWDEMLELIMLQNGVGVRQLNPFLRQVYFLKEDHSGLRLITNNPTDLLVFPSNERVAFFISPEPSDVRRTWFFLEKFINPRSMVMQMIGRDILLIGQVSEIEELLKLYDFILANRGDKEYKTVTLTGVDPEEMAKILEVMFGVLSGSQEVMEVETVSGVKKFRRDALKGPLSPMTQPPMDDNGLKVIPLPAISNAIFLIGTREEIRKAENIIREVEDQVGETRGKVIHWYTTRHADPEELAELLYKIYNLMVSSEGLEQEGAAGELEGIAPMPPPVPPVVPPPPLRRPYNEGFFLDDRLVLNKLPPRGERPVNQFRENFIVDPKTGAIVMVVERDILPKLKDLICRLDVPKRMVQLEVVLFEKRLNRHNAFGLNLLRIGSAASGTTTTSALFNDIRTKKGNNKALAPFPLTRMAGVFEFLISRPEQGGMPAFDLAYKFLLTQEDVHIHASPSVLAINQTQASIEIADEISVNTGIFEVETVGGVTLKDAFARAQYGIKIDITPTIHIADDECIEACNYVDLITDINFQTIKPNAQDRPDVTTRHVLNEVSIPDGQTVIIGGLRQRNSRDHSDKIPFLGEIPYVGKLFSLTDLRDETTEMFIFITPTIVYDHCEDLLKIRSYEMTRRPGDIPGFMCQLVAAQDREKYRLFAANMAMVFGRRPDRCVYMPGEYDGR